jgi:7-carboxy-7-deazaguanine synthase
LVETGGYFPTTEVDPRAKIILDIKCPDSGEESRNHWPNLERLRWDKDEVKFVIASVRDWEYAVEVIRKYELERRAKILISPAWGTIDLQHLADLVSASGLDLRMQLQLHKYIWGPEVHGV